jgi:hypothetical protein
MRHCYMAEGCDILPPLVGNEKLREDESLSGFSSPPQSARQMRSGRHSGKIPGSVHFCHDNQRENLGGYPSSGHKNPEQPFPVLSVPWKEDHFAKPPGKDQYTENSSWNCACI